MPSASFLSACVCVCVLLLLQPKKKPRLFPVSEGVFDEREKEMQMANHQAQVEFWATIPMNFIAFLFCALGLLACLFADCGGFVCVLCFFCV